MQRSGLATSIAILCVAADAPVARATCDSCCEVDATLIGWSEDRGSYAVIRRYDRGDEQELAVIAPERERVWSAYVVDPDPPLCVEPAARLPGRAGADSTRIDVMTWKPLRSHRLHPVAATWRRAFRDRFTVTAVASAPSDPASFGAGADARCTSWELRDRDGDWVATLPRTCDDSSDLGSLEVLGGYLHADGERLLVKIRSHFVGLSIREDFVAFDLRDQPRDHAAPPLIAPRQRAE